MIPRELKLEPCPQCEDEGRHHLIWVCVDCGWPPALDGGCCCEPSTIDKDTREEEPAA